MESVKRYRFKGAAGDYVYAADFDRVTAEREALQLLLNNRDDLDDQLTSLEQRRYAEQQAREAAQRRVEELEGLLHALIRRLGLEAVGDITGWSYTHPSNDLEEMISNGTLVRDLTATLNLTAEAVSHE